MNEKPSAKFLKQIMKNTQLDVISTGKNNQKIQNNGNLSGEKIKRQSSNYIDPISVEKYLSSIQFFTTTIDVLFFYCYFPVDTLFYFKNPSKLTFFIKQILLRKLTGIKNNCKGKCLDSECGKKNNFKMEEIINSENFKTQKSNIAKNDNLTQFEHIKNYCLNTFIDISYVFINIPNSFFKISFSSIYNRNQIKYPIFLHGIFVKSAEKHIVIQKKFYCCNKTCRDPLIYLFLKNNSYLISNHKFSYHFFSSSDKYKCFNCHEQMNESFEYRKIKKILFGRLINGIESIECTFENLKNYDLEINQKYINAFGTLNRNNLGFISFSILSYWQDRPKINKLIMRNHQKKKENNTIEQFFEEIEICYASITKTIFTILSIFLISEPSLIIYTDDTLFLRRIAKNFFILVNKNINVYFSYKKLSNILIILDIKNNKQYKCDFKFQVLVDNYEEIKYNYFSSDNCQINDNSDDEPKITINNILSYINIHEIEPHNQLSINSENIQLKALEIYFKKKRSINTSKIVYTIWNCIAGSIYIGIKEVIQVIEECLIE